MVWVTGVVVIDNMIHNLSIDSHIFVSDLNSPVEMEEERGTHDMCAVCLLSSLSYRHHDDQIMKMMISINDDDDDQYR